MKKKLNCHCGSIEAEVEVPEKGIPHFVSHVVPDTKNTRYAITGWLS